MSPEANGEMDPAVSYKSGTKKKTSTTRKDREAERKQFVQDGELDGGK